MNDALQKLTKWRTIFAGWQLGTRSVSDAEAQAVRDHREVTILLRAELSALVALLIEKGLVESHEWLLALETEAYALDKAYAERFPGITATLEGIVLNTAVIQEHGTMKGWLS